MLRRSELQPIPVHMLDTETMVLVEISLFSCQQDELYITSNLRPPYWIADGLQLADGFFHVTCSRSSVLTHGYHGCTMEYDRQAYIPSEYILA
jgi:hypothetical protein